MAKKSIALSEQVRFDIHIHDKEDRYISRSILDHGIWAPGETAHVIDTIRPGDLFVDVGANIGWFSLVAASLGATVIAFEPDPENFDILTRNTHGFESIKCHQIAISDTRGSATLYKSPFNLGDHRLFGDDSRESFAVRTETLSAMVDTDIDFIKSDTQGHESQVFEGMADYFASGRKRPRLMFELWPNGLTASGSSSTELARVLAGYGYETGGIVPTAMQLPSEMDFEAHTTVMIG